MAAVATAILNFQKWPPLKTQNCYNFGIHVNICMKICVFMASCITNHTKFENILHDYCNSLHKKNSKWPPPKTQNCYNFGLHVNIWVKFCVLMASYVTNQIIQNVRTYHLVLVIAAIKNFQNGRHWKHKIVITLVYMWIFA